MPDKPRKIHFAKRKKNIAYHVWGVPFRSIVRMPEPMRPGKKSKCSIILSNLYGSQLTTREALACIFGLLFIPLPA